MVNIFFSIAKQGKNLFKGVIGELIIKLKMLYKLLCAYKITVILISITLTLTIGGGYYYFFNNIPRIIILEEAQMLAVNAANAAVANMANNNQIVNYLEPNPMDFWDAMYFFFNRVRALAEFAPRNLFVDFMIERHPENVRYDIMERPYFIIDDRVLINFQEQVANNNIALPEDIEVDLQELIAEFDYKQYGAVQISPANVMKAIAENNAQFKSHIDTLKTIGFNIMAGGGIGTAVVIVVIVVMQNM